MSSRENTGGAGGFGTNAVNRFKLGNFLAHGLKGTSKNSFF
jgi:hypothetical protein